MGLFDWFKPDEEDRSLVEISNDSGDHWVADIPRKGVEETERALREAGVERDTDDRLLNVYRPDLVVKKRDSQQYRYRSERVVDEGEDLEDSYDQENDASDLEDDRSDWEDDRSDFEESEQPTSWFSWW